MVDFSKNISEEKCIQLIAKIQFLKSILFFVSLYMYKVHWGRL